jgi:hypothetical protein
MKKLMVFLRYYLDIYLDRLEKTMKTLTFLVIAKNQSTIKVARFKDHFEGRI